MITKCKVQMKYYWPEKFIYKYFDSLKIVYSISFQEKDCLQIYKFDKNYQYSKYTFYLVNTEQTPFYLDDENPYFYQGIKNNQLLMIHNDCYYKIVRLFILSLKKGQIVRSQTLTNYNYEGKCIVFNNDSFELKQFYSLDSDSQCFKFVSLNKSLDLSEQVFAVDIIDVEIKHTDNFTVFQLTQSNKMKEYYIYPFGLNTPQVKFRMDQQYSLFIQMRDQSQQPLKIRSEYYQYQMTTSVYYKIWPYICQAIIRVSEILLIESSKKYYLTTQMRPRRKILRKLIGYFTEADDYMALGRNEDFETILVDVRNGKILQLGRFGTFTLINQNLMIQELYDDDQFIVHEILMD